MLMPCAAQVFSPVTAANFNCIVAKAAAAGIKISGNAGEMSESGFTVQWQFDPVANTLSIQCTDKPFIVSCGTVNGRIHDIVDGCQEAASGQPQPAPGGSPTAA
jgi:hypothetical protein